MLPVHRDVSKRYLMMMTYFSLGKSGPNTVLLLHRFFTGFALICNCFVSIPYCFTDLAKKTNDF